MDKQKALDNLSRKMEDYGLLKQGWTYSFNNRKSSLGLCSFWKKEISLSKVFVELNEEKYINNTILHEIAHALVGPGYGHGLVWKQKAIELGAIPRARTYSNNEIRMSREEKIFSPELQTSKLTKADLKPGMEVTLLSPYCVGKYGSRLRGKVGKVVKANPKKVKVAFEDFGVYNISYRIINKESIK